MGEENKETIIEGEEVIENEEGNVETVVEETPVEEIPVEETPVEEIKEERVPSFL